MLSMLLAAFSPASARARTLGLLAALVTAVTPAMALADTGGPSPRGYTDDVAVGPQDTSDQYADNDPSALTDFRDTLDPHGTWVQDPTYGTVWVPNAAEVGSDFAPYQSSGHWAVADSGDWAWESDYSWGYVPFHYGRWVWTGGYWGWIPGRVYAPAWVTWRVGEDGYIGWAPLPPTWYWADGYAVGLWTVPYAAYCFVPTSYVFYNHVSTYVVRDRGLVQRAAAGTRPYHAAHPSRGGAAPHGVQHRSPTFAAAHIPASAVPQQRVRADARAMSYATRSATYTNHRASATRGLGAGRTSYSSAGSQRGNAWLNHYGSAGSSANAGRAQAPSYRATQPSHRATPPTYHSAPAQRTAPSFHSSAPSYHRSAPSFSRPSGVPSYGRPSSAPSFSRPSSSTVSRPSAPHSSGGGRGGGGRRR